jgi:hypothetical protein
MAAKCNRGASRIRSLDVVEGLPSRNMMMAGANTANALSKGSESCGDRLYRGRPISQKSSRATSASPLIGPAIGLRCPRDAYGGKDLNHCDYWNPKSIKVSLLGAEIREASGLVWMYFAEHPKVVLSGLMAEQRI